MGRFRWVGGGGEERKSQVEVGIVKFSLGLRMYPKFRFAPSVTIRIRYRNENWPTWYWKEDARVEEVALLPGDIICLTFLGDDDE